MTFRDVVFVTDIQYQLGRLCKRYKRCRLSKMSSQRTLSRGVSLVGSSVLTAAPPRPTLVLASVEVPYRWWCAEP
jgi:hypothetical protein